MDAVLELIWSGSYGSTTIDHICEKAGVKKGSFYYFFDSKAELAAEAFEANWLNHRAEFDWIHLFADGSAVGTIEEISVILPIDFSVKSNQNMVACWVARRLRSALKSARRRMLCRKKSRKSWIKNANISNPPSAMPMPPG